MAANKHSSLSTRRRRRAQRVGNWGERVAELWLRAKGYRVLARGFRTPVGEIDLIVRRGAVIAFVEVKTRAPGPSGAEEALVTPRQWRRVARAAEAYLGRSASIREVGSAPDLRFDLVLVRAWTVPRHRPDAWRPP